MFDIYFQVVYFTSLFPYLVLFIFLIRGLTLEGAGVGIKRMFKPDVSTLGRNILLSHSIDNPEDILLDCLCEIEIIFKFRFPILNLKMNALYAYMELVLDDPWRRALKYFSFIF